MKRARKETSQKRPEVRSRTEADYRKKYFDNTDGTKLWSKETSKPAETKKSSANASDTRRKVKSMYDNAKKSEPQKKSTRQTSSKTQSRTKKSTPKKVNKELRKKILAAVGMALFVAVIVLVGIGAGMYASVYNELEDMNIQSLALNYSSFVYYNDANGNAVEETQLHYQGERRIWVESEDISINLKNAAVAIEDERFYKHNGVDLKRTAGATAGWLLEKIGIGNADYGGSTLTQQLVKNITNERDKSATRKIKEMMRAIALEKQIGDKDTILTMYLNISYFGNQCNGVEAAANLYFSKSAKDVTPAEAATIVGITQRPAFYDPIKNPDNSIKKRNTVLAKMQEFGYITDEEYEEAVNSPLALSENILASKKEVYSYFVDAVINEVIADLVSKKGLSASVAEQMVFNGGLKIYTTMDKDVQEDIEYVYENRVGVPSNKVPKSVRGKTEYEQPQSAMVIIDPKNGEVKGLVGGVGVKTDARGLNRATQGPRQPGSSIKPLSVYAPGIDVGKLNSATVLKDEKININNWSPSNSYSGYKGNMSLAKCVEVSSNVTAVKALQEIGLDTSYDYARYKFHLDSIKNEDRSYAPLALGGLTDGVTVVQMAAAYAALANDGMYNEPHTYTKVLDASGKILLEYKPAPKRAVSEETAFIMTDILEGVITGSAGTGKAAKLKNMPAYGKTGTTNEAKDKWFVGYTTRYVGAVWVGCDTPSDLRKGGIRNNPSCVIWKNVMDRVHEGLEAESFTPPEGVKKATLCSKTGKLASSGCGYAKTGYFATGNIPISFCKNTCYVAPEPEPEEIIDIEPGTEAEGNTTTDTEAPNNTTAPETVPPSVQVPDTPDDDDDVITID